MRQEIKRLRDMVGFVEVIAPDGAAILVDGEERGIYPTVSRIPVAAVVVHQVMARSADGTETPVKRTTVSGGDTVTVDLIEKEAPLEKEPVAENEETKAGAPEEGAEMITEPTAEASNREKGLWGSGIALAGAGGAALVAGSICGGVGLVKDDLVRDRCPDGICDPQYEDLVNTRDNLILSSAILWGAGGVVAATGIALMVVARLKKRDGEKPDVAVVPGIGGLAIIGAF